MSSAQYLYRRESGTYHVWLRVSTKAAADDDRHKVKASLKFSGFMLEFFKRKCGHLTPDLHFVKFLT